MKEIGVQPMRLSRFAALYWHEGEWEKDGKQTAIAWSPIGFDAPKNARPNVWGSRITFYDHTGNNKLANVAIHDIGILEGAMVFLGDRHDGAWYEFYSQCVVYRESAAAWFVQWSAAKNTRLARAMNAVMLAWSADHGVPVPTIADLSRAVLADPVEA